MAIIKQYHKDTDTTYVYESTSYWDPVKKQSRSKRRVIGKVDPVTGDIVPTGKRGGSRRSKSVDGKKSAAADNVNDDQTAALKKRLAECSRENEQMKKGAEGAKGSKQTDGRPAEEDKQNFRDVRKGGADHERG